MRNSIKFIFTLSLLLNVVLLGYIGRHEYDTWEHHPWQETREALSPEARNLVARTFQSAFREIREAGDKARKIRSDLVDILSAPAFDPKAFDKTAKKLMDSRQIITALKIKATKQVAEDLSPEDRAKMAERMTDMIGGGGRKDVNRDRNPMELSPEDLPPSEQKDLKKDKKAKK